MPPTFRTATGRRLATHPVAGASTWPAMLAGASTWPAMLAGASTWLALLAGAVAQTPDATVPSAPAPAVQAGPPALTLKAAFEAAWALQPEARSLPARREAVDAQRRSAAAWTPEPPAFEARHKTDRVTRNDGVRELEVGVAVPLWLPGERRHAAALAQAQSAGVDARVEAARWRVAAAVREAWWQWHRAALEADAARAQRASARRLAADVARRATAGELARADRHQADGAVAAADAAVAQAEAATIVASQALQALGVTPGPTPGVTAGFMPGTTAGTTAGFGAPTGEPLAEPDPSGVEPPLHPMLVELQAQSDLADRTSALARVQSRAHPELTLATSRERGAAGERWEQTVTLGLRLPFGGGPRHDATVASARGEALEAQAQLALEQARVRAERDTAAARVSAARAQLAAAQRRADLARETRGFFDKSFRLGETDLPTRLRVEAEAAEAERQAAGSRVELAAAISAWRQALGLLPE